MRVGVFLVFFSLIAVHLKAQVNAQMLASDTATFTLQYQTENYLQSNFLTNQTLGSLVFSNPIEGSAKERQVDALKRNNTFFAELDQRFSATFQVNSKWYLGVEVADRLLSYGSFSGQALSLALQGNAAPNEQIVNFSTTELNFQRFQSFQLIAKKRTSQKGLFHFSLGYLNGERFFYGSASGSRLFTDPYGTDLVLDARGQVFTSDTSNQKAFANNGRGLTAGLAFEAFFNPDQPQKGSAKIYVQDLGYIRWNNQTIHYRANNTYTFDGIYIDNITSYSQSVFEEQSPDTILQEILNSGQKDRTTTFLPLRYGFVISKSFQPQSISFAGVEFRLVNSYFPFFYLRHQKHFENGLFVCANGFAGGMGIFGLGAGVGLEKNKWRLQLSSQQLDALVLPAYRHGVNIFVEATYRIP